MNKSKLIQMFVALVAIIILVTSLNKLVRGDSMSIAEYAQLHATSDDHTPPPESDGADPEGTPDDPGTTSSPDTETDAPDTEDGTSDAEHGTPNTEDGTPDTEDGTPDTELGTPNTEDGTPDTAEPTSPTDDPEEAVSVSQLTGAALNGLSQQEQRFTLEDGFYYEPLSDNLRRYITGVSYPAQTADNQEPEDSQKPAITLDELRYVHILHYDFNGDPVEGELICNEAIAQDLVEIFYELYRNEYQLERVLLIDEYDGDDRASMTDNNTSCFNYRVVTDTNNLSKHALGLAIDVNPFYNPYVAYNKDGSKYVSPAAAEFYADRSASFPYKIDENDLCYKLFTQHGFIWGGNWNSIKDYQHFQKTIN